MHRNYQWLIVSVLLAGLFASACAPIPQTSTTVKPAQVEPIEGSKLKRVTLTEKAAQRIGIQTAEVREEQVVRTRTVGAEVVDAASPRGLRVRVRLNNSDLSQVDRSRPVRVIALDDDEDDDGLEAEADDADDVDDAEDGAEAGGSLYYTVADGDPKLTQGQRVWVRLTLAGSGATRKIVPFAAILYDTEGHTWVYTNPQPLVFMREAVTIDYVEGELAVLSDGPAAGTKVVTVGGSLLYGAETGVSK